MINSEPHEIIGWHDPKDNFAGHGNAKSQFKPTPCFSISCPQPDLEEKLTKQINALQGKVCANLLKYDPDCTHLLCDKIGSSEKTLSCISSGKWLLTFDYIEKSHTAGRFLDVSFWSEKFIGILQLKYFIYTFVGGTIRMGQPESEEFACFETKRCSNCKCSISLAKKSAIVSIR